MNKRSQCPSGRTQYSPESAVIRLAYYLFVPGSSDYGINTSHYKESKEMHMTAEWAWMKGVEGSGPGHIWSTMLASSWKKTTQNISQDSLYPSRWGQSRCDFPNMANLPKWFSPSDYGRCKQYGTNLQKGLSSFTVPVWNSRINSVRVSCTQL
jgi:hypothetical protein